MCYTRGTEPSIVVERTDGGREAIAGVELGRADSSAVFERRGTIRRILVTVPAPPSAPGAASAPGRS